MGQQQLLLIILGVIIVGIAIAVGLRLFSAQSIQSSKDAIINDLNNIAAQAYQFRVRPSSMAGGNGSYLGFSIPLKMASNANAVYTCTPASDNVTFTATSANKRETWFMPQTTRTTSSYNPHGPVPVNSSKGVRVGRVSKKSRQRGGIFIFVPQNVSLSYINGMNEHNGAYFASSTPV